MSALQGESVILVETVTRSNVRYFIRPGSSASDGTSHTSLAHTTHIGPSIPDPSIEYFEPDHCLVRRYHSHLLNPVRERLTGSPPKLQYSGRSSIGTNGTAYPMLWDCKICSYSHAGPQACFLSCAICGSTKGETLLHAISGSSKDLSQVAHTRCGLTQETVSPVCIPPRSGAGKEISTQSAHGPECLPGYLTPLQKVRSPSFS